MPAVPMVSIAVGALALFIVCLLPVRENTGRGLAFLGVLAGAVATLAAVNGFLRFGDYVLDDRDERLIKGQILLVKAAARTGHVPDNFIIIEGSSQTAEDLDCVAMQRQLQQQGYDVLIVQLAIAGANNLERYTLVKRFSEEMRRQQLRYGKNTQLLVELHPGYETQPLALFKRDQDTLRGYYYSSFTNLGIALQTYRQLDQIPDRETLSSMGDMVSKAIMSSMTIGLLPDMERFDWLPGAPAFDANKDPWSTYKFTPYDPNELTSLSPATAPQVSPAVVHARAKRLAGLFGSEIGATGFFFLPSTDMDKMIYGHGFCRQSAADTCLDASAPAIYPELDELPYWFNADHLTTAGMEIYSRYFADLLVTRHVVIK